MSSEEETEGRSLVKNRTMEIVVALILLGLAGLVIKDTLRLGIGWTEGQGPASGYFPFYIACALAAGAFVTLVQALLGKTDDPEDSFVSAPAMGRILAVLIPSLLYVAMIGWFGIYISSLIFITVFMIFIGREPALRSVLVAVGVTVTLYVMFEKWFSVPLPKSASEVWAWAPPSLKDGLELYLDRAISPYFVPVYDALKYVGETLFPTPKK